MKKGKEEGKPLRTDMRLDSVKSKDEMAHETHHQMNKKHGCGGFNPPGEYECGKEGTENEECC